MTNTPMNMTHGAFDKDQCSFLIRSSLLAHKSSRLWASLFLAVAVSLFLMTLVTGREASGQTATSPINELDDDISVAKSPTPQPRAPKANSKSNKKNSSGPRMAPATPRPQEIAAPTSEVISVVPSSILKTFTKAILRTSMGEIVIRLDRGRAPLTVEHFTALARGEKPFIDIKTSKQVRRPFYEGLVFHRTIKGHLIQTGCPFGTGRGGPGEGVTVASEHRADMKFNRPGLVAMALARDKDGTQLLKDSAGSQFFITLRPMPDLNEDGYTIFGEVVSGLDVVAKIAASKTGPTERPIKKIFLTQLEIIESDSLRPAIGPSGASSGAQPTTLQEQAPAALPAVAPAGSQPSGNGQPASAGAIAP